MRGAILKEAFAQRRAVAAARGRRRPRVRRGRIPQPKRPVAVGRDYLAYLLPLLARVRALVDRYLTPQLPALAREANPNLDASLITDTSVRMDGYADTLEQILQLIRSGLADIVQDPQLRAQLRAFARRMDEFSEREVQAQVKRITAMDVVATAGDLTPKIDAFMASNVALIKSIPAQYLSQVEEVVTRNFRQGNRATEIAAELAERFEVTENRAALIAQDQVNKFNGELNQARHEAMGITRYIWRTSQDERVRPDHVERNGEVFNYDDPPEDGNPGQPIRCRCTADPVIEDVIGEPLERE